jgi:site-specific recombinase XerD
MAALAYDAGLRREELCSLQSSDLDPAHRLIRVRAEIAKGSRERMVPYSETSGELLKSYLAHRRTIAQTRGPLFLSESPRNFAQPISLWT